MAIILASIIFLAVVGATFSLAAAAYAPSSMLAARLKSLGISRAAPVQKSSIRERIDQLLDPLTRALPLSAEGASALS